MTERYEDMLEHGSDMTAEATAEVTEGGTTALEPVLAPVARLPLWSLLLHNDDLNEMGYVVRILVRMTAIPVSEAVRMMCEAHLEGVALVLETHRERAEFLAEQLGSAGLTASIEPAC